MKNAHRECGQSTISQQKREVTATSYLARKEDGKDVMEQIKDFLDKHQISIRELSTELLALGPPVTLCSFGSAFKKHSPLADRIQIHGFYRLLSSLTLSRWPLYRKAGQRQNVFQNKHLPLCFKSYNNILAKRQNENKKKGGEMFKHYMTTYKEGNCRFVESWLQVSLFGKVYCFSKRKMRVGR